MNGAPNTAPPAARDGADVMLRNVFVSYQSRSALENVSLSIPAGSFQGIIGPNGSGKTTLIKSIVGLVRPDAGDVLVFGRPPERLGDFRTRIGYVPQHAQIDFRFPLRVIDAVTTGLYGRIGLFRHVRAEHREAGHRALTRVGLEGLATRQIGALSGGERQRVLIARALVLEPRLLILDEPTSALDHSATEGLYDWLHALNESDGTTILLVSHDIGVVSRFVDAVACLNTRLVAHGRPADVLNSESLEAMYGCGAVLFEHGHIPHMVVPDVQHRAGAERAGGHAHTGQ